MSVKFSVIIPVYNVAPYLRECLDSVVAQTFGDWECVCVDDGSKDESGAILDEYAARDSRFRVFHQPNGGVSVARNRALDEVRGEYVAFLDGDDLWHEGLLAEMNRLINLEHPDGVRIEYTYSKENPLDKIDYDHSYEVLKGEALRAASLDAYQSRMATRYFWRRDKITSRFPVGIILAEDALWCLNILKSMTHVVLSQYRGYWWRFTAPFDTKRLLPSAERLRFFEHFEEAAQAYAPCKELSGILWNNLRRWCLSPADTHHARAIHRIVKRLIATKCFYYRQRHWSDRVPIQCYLCFGSPRLFRIAYKMAKRLLALRVKLQK